MRGNYCEQNLFRNSVADPGYWFLSIPDLGFNNSNKREGGKKFVLLFLYPQISQNCKLFIFDLARKKIWANLQRVTVCTFTQKLSLSSQIMGFGIRENPIPDPGVKKALDPGSGSATLVVVLWEAYQYVGFECLFFREKNMVSINCLIDLLIYNLQQCTM
jgi:hypothetical protein